jgi:hypothetical protein
VQIRTLETLQCGGPQTFVTLLLKYVVGPFREDSILLTEDRGLRDVELLLITFKGQGGTQDICATLQEIQGLNGGCTNLSPPPFLLIKKKSSH